MSTAIARLYPFGEVGTVCEVGGGRGTLLSELLVRYPHLKGILRDAPGLLRSARTLLEERGVLDRVVLSPGGFFDPVPAGADAYLLENVLNNCDGARCLNILLAVRKAMQPGQRLILIESQRSQEELERLEALSGFLPSRAFHQPTLSVLEGVAV
jgi:hypothetical protein